MLYRETAAEASKLAAEANPLSTMQAGYFRGCEILCGFGETACTSYSQIYHCEAEMTGCGSCGGSSGLAESCLSYLAIRYLRARARAAFTCCCAATCAATRGNLARYARAHLRAAACCARCRAVCLWYFRGWETHYNTAILFLTIIHWHLLLFSIIDCIVISIKWKFRETDILLIKYIDLWWYWLS